MDGSGIRPHSHWLQRETLDCQREGETTLPAGTNVAASPFIDTTAVNGTTYFYEVSALNYTAEISHFWRSQRH